MRVLDLTETASVFQRAKVRFDELFHAARVEPHDGEGAKKADGIHRYGQDRPLPVGVRLAGVTNTGTQLQGYEAPSSTQRTTEIAHLVIRLSDGVPARTCASSLRETTR